MIYCRNRKIDEFIGKIDKQIVGQIMVYRCIDNDRQIDSKPMNDSKLNIIKINSFLA